MNSDNAEGISGQDGDIDTLETSEWLASLDAVLQSEGSERAS